MVTSIGIAIPLDIYVYSRIFLECDLSNIFQAYMFKYDSTHGPFKGTIRVIDESTLEINGKQIKVTNKRYYHILQLVTTLKPTH